MSQITSLTRIDKISTDIFWVFLEKLCFIFENEAWSNCKTLYLCLIILYSHSCYCFERWILNYCNAIFLDILKLFLLFLLELIPEMTVNNWYMEIILFLDVLPRLNSAYLVFITIFLGVSSVKIIWREFCKNLFRSQIIGFLKLWHIFFIYIFFHCSFFFEIPWFAFLFNFGKWEIFIFYV